MIGNLVGLAFGAGFLLVVTRLQISPKQWLKPRIASAPWPHFIDEVAAGIRAGMSAPHAMFDAGKRLGANYAPLFLQSEREYTDGGGFLQALETLQVQIESRTFHQFASTMRLIHINGGTMVASLLSQLSRDVRASQQLIHEVRGRQAVTIVSAKVAVAAPWLVLLFTSSRAEVRKSFSEGTGLVVLIAVAIVTALSYMMMRSVAKIPALEVMR